MAVLSDVEQGYCQGMNFLISVLLHRVNYNEKMAVLAFEHLLVDHSMDDVFRSGLVHLQQLCYVFDRLILAFAPQIHEKIVEDLGVQTEYMTLKWCLTLYTCFLPPELTGPICELFIVDGWSAVFAVGISLLNGKLGDRIMQCESMMDLSQYFREEVRTDGFDSDEVRRIIFDAHRLKISPSIIERFHQIYKVTEEQREEAEVPLMKQLESLVTQYNSHSDR